MFTKMLGNDVLQVTYDSDTRGRHSHDSHHSHQSRHSHHSSQASVEGTWTSRELIWSALL